MSLAIKSTILLALRDAHEAAEASAGENPDPNEQAHLARIQAAYDAVRALPSNTFSAGRRSG
jgi:hypothetical protein